MKIAMIGQKGVPVSSGGVEKHVEELGRRLVERGHNVTVYNRTGYSEITDNQYLGMKLKNVFTVNNKNLEAIIYSFLAGIDSIYNDYDIVHFHALGPATMCFIPRIANKKVIVTVHGLDWQRGKWGKFAKLYLKLGEKASAYFPHKTITVSNKLKRIYEQKYKKTVHFIPNGISLPKTVEANIIKKYGLNGKDYILFLARIVPEKGCHYLLESYKKVKTDVKLVIAGGSSHTDEYYKKLKEYACENIVFTGEVRGKEVNELYSNALFYVLPSEIEGLPISLLEAMSYGVCALVSNIEENLEVIEGDMSYGYSFAVNDIRSLTEKLQYMLDNLDEVQNMGKAAQQYIIRKYSWDHVVDELESLYKTILHA